nr:hypothetical protein [Tanacetum cinerariifolium]
MAAGTGYAAGSFPFSYLGLPIGSNMGRIINWKVLIDRFKSRVKVVKSIHEDEVGININGCQTNGLCASIAGTINHLHSSGIIPLSSMYFKVGGDSLIHFWKDTWLGAAPLCTRYNKLFHLAKEKNCLVRDRIDNGSWLWDWSRPINMRRSQAEFVSLLGEIGDMEIDDDSDSCIWSLSHDGDFSVLTPGSILIIARSLICFHAQGGTTSFLGRLTFLCGACFWIGFLVLIVFPRVAY